MTTVRRRGKGKKEAMKHVGLRISAEALAYYEMFESPTVKMREVLEHYTKTRKKLVAEPFDKV